MECIFCLATADFSPRYLSLRGIWHSGALRTRDMKILTLITPAPVRANMIQTLVHSCRGLGCSIFIETNVKRQSNPLPFKVCSIQQCTEHIQPSTNFSKNDSKKCVHFGTTARVKTSYKRKWAPTFLFK